MLRPSLPAALLVLLLPAYAFAQGTAGKAGETAGTNPDAPKPYGGYTLFNPTPDDLLRNLNPDRPSKATGPVTVDAGRLQIETDLLGYLRASTPDTRTRLFYTADPLIKLGLTDHWDIEVQLGGYQNLVVRDRAAGTTTRASGFGDVTLRTKINLWGNNGGDTALGIEPYVKLPTAAPGLGNNQVEGGVLTPFTFNLPWKINVLLMTEVDEFKNVNDSGHHVGFTNLISVSRPVTEALRANVEFWSQVQTAHTPTQYSLDLAAAYVIGANTQLDAGVYIGLNRDTPGLIAYFGVSRRF